MLANKNILKLLLAEKPTLKDKILNFLKGTTTDYDGIAKLDKASKKLLNQYKKLFDEFSSVNSNQNSMPMIYVKREKEDVKFDLKESIITLNKYNKKEKESILKNKNYSIALSYQDIIDFIKNSKSRNLNKQLFIGKISQNLANKIYDETNTDLLNKSIVLDNNNIVHIFKNHGNETNESQRGQISITQYNVINIIDTILTPNKIYKNIDNNGVISFIFEKNINGNNVAITILSNKKNTLT